MEKWMVVLVAAGFLIPYGTVLAVTGNIHGAEYVRQQEKEGGLSLLTDGSPQAICLTETQDQQSYTTYIYVYNGYLMELLVPAHYSFSPENGIRLFPMERMELSVLTDGIFSILLTDPEGTPFQLYQTERNML